MECCDKQSIMKVMGPCNSKCHIIYPDGIESHNYGVPSDMNIGGDWFLNISYCINCGKIVGKFPVKMPRKR